MTVHVRYDEFLNNIKMTAPPPVPEEPAIALVELRIAAEWVPYGRDGLACPGDRVRVCTGKYEAIGCGGPPKGTEGVVVGTAKRPSNSDIPVEFGVSIPAGHTAGGRAAYGHGYWMMMTDLEVYGCTIKPLPTTLEKPLPDEIPVVPLSSEQFVMESREEAHQPDGEPVDRVSDVDAAVATFENFIRGDSY